MHTVVITGITGKSGQFLLQRMMKEVNCLQEYKFILLCRKKDRYSKNTEGYNLLAQALLFDALNVELIETDLENADELEYVFANNRVDMLLHIASVKLSWNIVPVALKNGVDNFILVHTTGIYSKYKAAGEEYRRIEAKINGLVKEYKNQGREVAVTILRPTMIYGDLNDKNISTFIKMVDNLRIFPTINGAKYDLQPVWCKDLGDAYLDVLLNWNITRDKEYILSGGEPIQLRNMFKVMAEQLGVKNTFISCPFVIAYAGAWIVYVFSFGKADFREKVQRMVESRAYPHDEAEKDFGFHPAVFQVGVRDEIEMYKESKR